LDERVEKGGAGFSKRLKGCSIRIRVLRLTVRI
jgi:hypothetical protein